MSIIQEALRRKTEDPNAPPPFPVAPPPVNEPPPPRHGRKLAVVLLVVLVMVAAGLGGLYLLLRIGFQSWMNTVSDQITIEFEYPADEPAVEAEAPPVEAAAPPAPSPEPAAPPPPEAPAQVTWPRLTLTGLIAPQAGRGGAALFRETGVLGEDESFRGVRVIEVRPEGVTLEYRGHRMRLREGQSTADDR